MENKKLSYNELKEFFKKNEKELPRKVGNSFMIVFDVVGCYKLNVEEIEREIKKGDPTRSIVAKAAKGRLQTLYEMVIDPETHEVEGFKNSTFSNYRNKTKEC